MPYIHGQEMHPTYSTAPGAHIGLQMPHDRLWGYAPFYFNALFKIFTLEQYSDLKTRSFKVIGNDTIREIIYDFL